MNEDTTSSKWIVKMKMLPLRKFPLRGFLLLFLQDVAKKLCFYLGDNSINAIFVVS